jgi:hypothetical protein
VNRILVLILVLVAFITPLQQNDTEYRSIDGDVFTGGQLPYWGTLCSDAHVYGDPYGLAAPLQTLPAGEIVALHELSKPDSSWVMIGPAQWVALSSVCDW